MVVQEQAATLNKFLAIDGAAQIDNHVRGQFRDQVYGSLRAHIHITEDSGRVDPCIALSGIVEMGPLCSGIFRGCLPS